MYPNNESWGAVAGGPQAPAGYGPPPQQPWGAPQPQQWLGQQAAPQPAARPAVAPPDPDELMSGGHKAAVFPDQQFGTVVGGRIVEKPMTTQQLDFDSRQPKFYDDGNPMWQVVVAVQAQPATDDDDGIRAFYLKSQMKKAVQEAVRRGGAGRLEVGGELQIRYVRDEPNSRGRGKPKKIYEARYTPPTGQPAGERPVSAPVSGLPNPGRPPQPAAAAFTDEAPF